MMARPPPARATLAAAVLAGWLAVSGLASAQPVAPPRDPLFGGVTVYPPVPGRAGFGASAARRLTPTTPSTILDRARRPPRQNGDGAACAGRFRIPQARIVCP